MPTIATNGITLAYDDEGQGEAILFIHGIFVARNQWRPQVNYFAPAYRVITCDLRGHGESAASSGPYSVALLASDVIGLLDTLGLERVVCCGHSFGGLVAQELALTYPDRVQGLILVETLYGLCSTPWEAAWTALLNVWVTQFIGLDTQVKWFARYFGMETPGAETYILHASQRHLQDQANGYNILDASFKFDSRWRLHQIACPTLILTGQSSLVPLVHWHAYEMSWRINQARLEIISNAGHILHWDNPQAFNKTVAHFVAELINFDHQNR